MGMVRRVPAVVVWASIVHDMLEPLIDHLPTEVLMYPNASQFHADGKLNDAQWSICIRVEHRPGRFLTLTKDFNFDIILQDPKLIHAAMVKLVHQAQGWFTDRLPKRIE